MTDSIRGKFFFLVLLAALALGASAGQDAHAQTWHMTTPRDTFFVPAYSPNGVPPWTVTKHSTPYCVSTEFYFSGLFGIFPGLDSNTLDARYMYSDPNWNAPLPLPSPATFNGTKYNVYLEICNNQTPIDSLDTVHVLEGYEQNHNYTAIYPGAGVPFEFRIYNRLNQQPNGSFYRQATGGITVRSAQYTAGISIQYNSLSFPNTNVGTVSRLVDSIACYGIDPLEVDSVWIGGPQASNFSLSSQRGNRFTLDSESSNWFVISYTPLVTNVESNAWLYLRCPNADCGHRLDSIPIAGYSVAPNGTIGPDTLDFGTVNVNTFHSLVASVSNIGSANYTIDSIQIFPAGPFAGPGSTVLPQTVQPGSTSSLQFSFTPPLAQSYEAWAYIYDNNQNGNRTTLVLKGTGASSRMVLSDTDLNFGTVFTGGDSTIYDTLTNTGTATAHIVIAKIECDDPYYFGFTPSDTTFYLDAGASRVFAITFGPESKSNQELTACFHFYLDDGSQPATIHLTGTEKQREIHYDTNIVNFGRVKIGLSAQQTLGLENLSSHIVYAQPTMVPLIGPTSFFDSGDTIFDTGSNSISLKFTPVLHGGASAMLHLVCNTGQIDSIYLFGYGAIADPVFNPPIVDFGLCKDGTTNYSETTISDTGDFPLDICNLEIIGPDASEFTFQSKPSTPYLVNDSNQNSLVVGLNFTTNAHAGRLHTATLVIQYCDGSSDSIPLRAQEVSETVQPCWLSVDFGTVHVGATRDTGVCFSNPESISIDMDSIWIAPGSNAFFSKDTSANAPPLGNYYDSTAFTPPFRGVFNGWMHYTSLGDSKIDSIPLAGIGAEEEPMLSTHTLNFGAISLLTTSGVQQFSLKNLGNWLLTTQIVKVGDPDEEFNVELIRSGALVDDEANDTVAIGDSSFYAVTFTPKFPELPNHKAELIFAYSNGALDTVYLIGRDHSGYLAFNRDTLDFGLVRVGGAPSTLPLEIFNTSDTTLTAKIIAGPSLPFTAVPVPPIPVDSQSAVPMTVTFTPQFIGRDTSWIAGIGTPFQSGSRDSVFVVGIGAAPAPKLSVDTLFFDTVALGRAITRNFMLSDTGNWPLVVTTGPISGANALNFSEAIPADTTLDAGDSVTYAVTFQGTPPIQVGPRVGYITWTADDGSQFELVLIAYDVQPYPVHIGFPHAYWGRPNDKIAAELDLQNTVPDSLGIQHLVGSVSWDSTVVQLASGGGPTLDTNYIHNGWTPGFPFVGRGSFSYDISSTSDTLSKPGTLLNFTLQLLPNLEEGASTPLIDTVALPGIVEAVAPVESTTVFLDSVCGAIHLLAGGQPVANFIEQNIPNPFGGALPTTTIAFDVDADNTLVTIRLLDPTGREMLRPVNSQPFARGRYQTTIDATTLPTGIYFYEFQANGEPPQMLKMAVE